MTITDWTNGLINVVWFIVIVFILALLYLFFREWLKRVMREPPMYVDYNKLQHKNYNYPGGLK